MKKFLLGCTLILSGTIGFIGTLIAANFSSGSNRILGGLYGSDHIIAAVFLIVALLGVGLSIYGIKDDK